MEFPTEFVSQTCRLLGDAECARLVESLQNPASVSIRLNPGKAGNGLPPSALSLERVPWATDGYYLDQRLTFTFDPLFHAGAYYVQEASSMFIEQALHQHVDEPVLALDLCAAPGGKSTLLRSALPHGSFVVANEVIRSRSNILAENLVKWGNPDVMVTNNDPADFARTRVQFDLILADVPCSGEGMFRKDEGAVKEWSPANVEICRQRQRRIVADIWPSLRPGGILVYSTCTFNSHENEENVAWIADELGAESLAVAHDERWNITGNLAGSAPEVYRFLPHKVRGEGFFMAVLRKHDEPQAHTAGESNRRKKDKKTAADELFVPSPYYEAEQEKLKKHLRVLHTGLTLGERKGKDVVPSHALAMSSSPHRDIYNKVEVDYHQAIAYLRKEAIVLENGVPLGYILLIYKGFPLGFVKNLGNRANNLYPADWRIRSGYLPDDLKVL